MASEWALLGNVENERVVLTSFLISDSSDVLPILDCPTTISFMYAYGSALRAEVKVGTRSEARSRRGLTAGILTRQG